VRAAVDRALRIQATGSPASVRARLAALIERHRPDELILTGQIHDHAARLRSFEIAAEVLAEMESRQAA
jgi:alkanesulfonate monooxygenase SsuD/methylene tetrahydromethanopterin reductase-like flavin-dependent oxidoreductase (luciferase family)